MSFYNAAMAFEDLYTRKFLATLEPHVRALMLDAFVRAYEMGEADAQRWRFVVDETIQDRQVSPLALGIGITDDVPNIAGNFNVVRWGAAWDIAACQIVDRYIGAYEARLKGS